MKRTYGAWDSPSLGRNMEYLWFGDRGRPLLLFPTSMGRFYQNEDFGLVGALAEKVDAGWIQVICVDSVDAESWYDKQAHPRDRVRRHDQYDRYLRDEMFPLIVQRTGGNIAVGGASFGAYHAANVAGRYPGLVTKAICFSGLYHMGRYLDGYWDETCYFHSPAAYLPNMDEEWCEPAPPGRVDRRDGRAGLAHRGEPRPRRHPREKERRLPFRILARRLRARLALLERGGQEADLIV